MKFVGSKQRLSKDIVPIIQKAIDIMNPVSYIEPFVGGANVIDKIIHNNKIGYDNNHYLIAMWNALKNGWVIPDRPTKKEYNEVKENKSKFPPEWVAIVGFVSTYNAKWFGGYANITKTKTGKIRDYYDEGKRNIEKQVPNIKDVTFEHSDFINLSFKDSVIYCDPPYKTPTTKNKLYGNEFDYEGYYSWVDKESKYNLILCSEYNMPNDFVCIYEKGLSLDFDHRQTNKRVERLFIHQNNAVECIKCGNYVLPSYVDGYNSYCMHCDEDFGYNWFKVK